MLETQDILPESNETLEKTKEFGSEFGDIIKDLEDVLKQDPDIKTYIEEVINGYNKIKDEKKEKIDKIDEIAEIEAKQEEYDQHFESLVESIIEVPSIYYREKIFNKEPEKKPIIILNTQNSNVKNIELTNKTKNTPPPQSKQSKSQNFANALQSNKKQNVPPPPKKPVSNPPQITKPQERKRLNVQVQKPSQSKIQIQKTNTNQNNNH